MISDRYVRYRYCEKKLEYILSLRAKSITSKNLNAFASSQIYIFSLRAKPITSKNLNAFAASQIYPRLAIFFFQRCVMLFLLTHERYCQFFQSNN